MPHDDNYDADRYDDAAALVPYRLYKGEMRKLARRRAREFPDFGENPFETAAGSRATAGPMPKPPAQLFGPLWCEGEIAVLFGPTGSGKSVLAVQLADHIARGRNAMKNGHRTVDNFFGNSPFSTIHSPLPPQKVLYIDFERTPAQFRERYSAPHPLPGKLPLRHRFPKNFIRASLGDLPELPDRFRGDPHAFLKYWLLQTIEETAARTVIIDNISYLSRSLASGSSAATLIKTLRLWANRFNLSILAVAHAKDSSFRNPHSAFRSGVSLKDLAAASPLADLADTVFAISPSSLGPDLRYIKHLKCRRQPPEHDAANVIVCKLGRDEFTVSTRGPKITYLPPGRPTFIRFDQLVDNGNPQSAFRTPQLGSPFLGLTNVGFSDEHVHLQDHSARTGSHRPIHHSPLSIQSPHDRLRDRLLKE